MLAVASPRAAAPAAFALVAGAVAIADCAPPRGRPPETEPREPRWQDAFNPPPKLVVVLRPESLRRDPLYGPLLRRALVLLDRQSRVVAATRAFEALESAEQIVIGVWGSRGDGDDVPLVAAVVGIRGDFDPEAVVDETGLPLWSPGPSGSVRELTRRREGGNGTGSTSGTDPLDASLFELGGRVWVVATGSARARVRDALTSPARRAPTAAPMIAAMADSEASLPVAARIDGPTLVARLPLLRPPAALAPLGRALREVTLELAPGSSAPSVRAKLAYATPEQAAAAAEAAREAVAAIARKKPDGIAWLGTAEVQRRPGAASVEVIAPLPPGLVTALEALSPQGSAAAIPDAGPRSRPEASPEP